MRKRIEDFSDLITAASKALTKSLNDGDDKHLPGSWMDELSGNHINHLLSHIRRVQSGDISEDHLSHIVCRAIMLYHSANKQ